MLKGAFLDIKEWLLETARIFRHEFSVVFHDVGVLIFFFALPLAYPIVYSLIYNPEVTRDMPVAVVDHDRTALSREFIRHADATPAMKICGYAANMEEARSWMAEKKCFAIFEIPEGYSRELGRGDQPAIQFYAEMSLLLRYRTFTSSLADLQIATGAQYRQIFMDELGVSDSSSTSTISAVGFALGDTQQGFASFIIPGIVVLILQQSMVLGVVLLGGSRQEQRRRLRGYLPPAPTGAISQSLQASEASSTTSSAGVNTSSSAKSVDIRKKLKAPTGDDLSPSAQIIGRALCYTVLYLPIIIYILHYVLRFFNYPHIGNFAQEMLFIFPLLFASAMFGQTLNIMASERESSFIIVVFTSLAFLFLSGLTWPLYAMPPFLRCISALIPATWGLEGFVRMNSNGAAMHFVARPWFWLWGLTAFYTLTAYLVARFQTRRPN